ncbi:hypothetical protein ACHAXS_005549 [Conticribra weissflogii]
MLPPTSSNFLAGGALIKCSSTFTSLLNLSPNIFSVGCFMQIIALSPVTLSLSYDLPISLPFSLGSIVVKTHCHLDSWPLEAQCDKA